MMQTEFNYDDVRNCAPIAYRFTGKERDTESGNDYFGARYYASTMGRFLTPDPMNLSAVFHPDDPQSWNGYSYGRNNPLTNTDPTGEVYTVCDNNGNCTAGILDQTFDSEKQQDIQNGERFDNGQMYHFDDNGTRVNDGTYQQTDVDSPGLSGPANLAGAQFLYNQTRPAVNILGAAAGAMVGAGMTAEAAPVATGIARWGLQRLAMSATAPALVNLINRLYQAQDEIPGGTAGAVRNEVMTGEYINGGHAIKASEMITALQNLVKSGTLSGSDQMIAGHIISDLKNSLGR
jgi:RHS repeat-associated protein